MNLTKTFRVLALLVMGVMTLGFFTGCSKEAKAKRHRARADSYFQKQEYSKAEVEYMNALRLAPKDPAVMRQLGILYYEQARMHRAVGALSESKKLDPQDADVRFRLGMLFLQFGDVTNARTEARFVLAQQPTNRQALFTLAESSRSEQDAAAIRSEINAFSAKNGLSPEVHVALAELDFRERNLASVEDHLKKAAALNPQSPFVNMSFARLRLAQTNISEGEAFLKRAAEASPFRSSYRLNWAGFKLRTGDRPLAREILQEVTAKAPDYVPAWNLLAEIALTEKDYEECAKITSSVLKLDPERIEARLLRGRMFVAQGQSDKAVEELTRLEALYPQASVVKYHLAVAHLRNGNLSKTTAALNQALQLTPGYPDAVTLQAELNLRSGNAPAAVNPLVQLLKAHPEHVSAAQLLAAAYQAQGKPDAALQIYRDLATRFPKNPEPPVLEGVVLRQQRKFSEARAAFERSERIAPAYHPAAEQLVELDLLATNYPAALARCSRLAASMTNSALPMLLEAKVHGARKDMKAAEQALLRGLDREPDSLGAFTLLAGLYSDMRDYSNALVRLDDMIRRNPKSAPAWMQKGVIYQALQENAKAKESYQRAIEANPNHAPALNNLAFMLSEEPGKLDEAFALATRARQAAPSDPSVADTVGWVHYKRRNFVPARALFAEASEKIDIAEVHYHLGLAEYGLGNEQRARESFEKAANGNLNPKLKEDANAHLAVLNFNSATAGPEDVARLEAAAKRDPLDYLVHLRLGLAYEKQKALEKAQTAFETASRANPQTSEPLLHLTRLLSGRDDARAYEIAKNARRLDPNNPSVALAYGTIALRQHDYSAALIALPEGLNASESTPDANYSLAVAQYAMGQLAPALATLQKLAIGNNPPAPAARDALTLINGTGQNAAQRTALAESRLKADPKDLIALAARAEIHEQQGQFKEAASRFEKAVEVSPDFWPARRRLAYIYAERLNDDKSALPHATKVRQVMPEDAVSAHVLGKIAFRRNEFANALRYFQEVARRESATGEPHYLVALTNLRLGRTNDSKTALSKALALPLPTPLSNDAKRLLAELK